KTCLHSCTLQRARSVPLRDEPGRNGSPVAFSRAMGKSITPTPWPVPACNGERAWTNVKRAFIIVLLTDISKRLVERLSDYRRGLAMRWLQQGTLPDQKPPQPAILFLVLFVSSMSIAPLLPLSLRGSMPALHMLHPGRPT